MLLDLKDNGAWIRTQTKLPIGFGISQPEYVRALAPMADGLIVGSAIVRRIAEGHDQPRDGLVRELGDLVAEPAQALQHHGD